MNADALAEIADEFRRRIRDEVDPEVNGRWLLSMVPDPNDWFRLCFVLGAALGTGRWLDMTRWAAPKPDLKHVDEIAVERACRGDKVKLTRVERAAVVEKLTKRGMGRYAIAELLGTSDRAVTRARAKRRAL